jgi:5,10-methylenetetrahydromethanopterin reductase
MTQVSVAFQSDKRLSEYGELAEIAEQCGFDTISIYNDLFYQPAWLPLMMVAQHTRSVRLGPAAVNPFLCHPVTIAGNAALLDEASNGRAYLGLARGAWLDALGIEPPSPIAAVREAIELIQHLWRGDTTAYDGRVFQLRAGETLRWTQIRNKLPILLGSWGERMVAATADLIDEVKLGGSANPALVRWMRARLNKQPRGQAIGIAVGAVTLVDDDRSVAEQWIRRAVVQYLPIVASLDPTFQVDPAEIAQIETLVARGELEHAAQRVSLDTLRRFAFFGTPAEIEKQISELAEAGADRIELGTPHGTDESAALRVLGQRVLPSIRAR